MQGVAGHATPRGGTCYEGVGTQPDKCSRSGLRFSLGIVDARGGQPADTGQTGVRHAGGSTAAGRLLAGRLERAAVRTLGFECTVAAQTTLEAHLNRSQRTDDLKVPQSTTAAAARARCLAALA